MKKLTVHEPVIVSQSTTEPILWGGYQDPKILCGDDKTLYVTFNSRRDCPETIGFEDLNPVYSSNDGGQTWRLSSQAKWINAHPKLSNGERFALREHPIVKPIDGLIPIPEGRFVTKTSDNASIGLGATYTVDELYPIFGEKIAKQFKAERTPAGESEARVEYCKINWKNMPIQHQRDFLWRMTPVCGYKVDKNGTMWTTVYGGHVGDDGSMLSKKLCTSLLRSDDFGHTWDYVSTINYEDNYNPPEAESTVEGFDEAALEILDDGTIIVIMRSGSLFPDFDGLENNRFPIPKAYIARSEDMGKTWCEVKPFHDYGIRPYSVKLDCGTVIVIAGRPGVYIKATHDPKALVWDDAVDIVKVPEDEVYNKYYEYSCCNADICAYDKNTAYITYSDFTRNAPDTKRAKSIMVCRITVDEI